MAEINICSPTQAASANRMAHWLEGLPAPATWFDQQANPFLIAGPCSVEGEEQMMATAKQIREEVPGVGMIRAGIWKPRTRPNSFEGVGEIGLPWLKAAGNEVGLPVTVEVANPEHVEAALKAGIDVLWIGARTTVNPFMVQEIADSLRGVDVPVMVKNPVNPDLELWIGGLERLAGSGIRKLAAIHRGFSSYEKAEFRNPPRWEIPIELRRRYPDVPILVDPSHIGGKRSLIQRLSQQAMDMGFDGLMIETHLQPERAWSDAAQQITPARLKEIVQSLIIRASRIDTHRHQPMNEMRARIDRLDDYIMELLSERMSISEQIGEYKKEHHIAIHQAERWSVIYKRTLEKARVTGLSEKFIQELFKQIHNESIYHQTKVMEKNGETVLPDGDASVE